MDINKHKFLMMQILRDVYSDKVTASALGFKGGTALMFFYDLPRFSVDLDFNLIDRNKERAVYDKMRSILRKYGKIDDEAMKFYGSVIVLDYGAGERKMKVEISNREYDNHYERKNLLGIDVQVLTAPDMFAHKLCALLDRKEMTGRDVFDCWFFLDRRTPLNGAIVKVRTGMDVGDYLRQCVTRIENMSDKTVMSGLGELTDGKMKTFARTKLRLETIQLMNFFIACPIMHTSK